MLIVPNKICGRYCTVDAVSSAYDEIYQPVQGVQAPRVESATARCECAIETLGPAVCVQPAVSSRARERVCSVDTRLM